MVQEMQSLDRSQKAPNRLQVRILSNIVKGNAWQPKERKEVIAEVTSRLQ